MNDGAAHQDGLKIQLIVPSFSIKSNSSLNTFSLVNGTGYALFQGGVYVTSLDLFRLTLTYIIRRELSHDRLSGTLPVCHRD